MSRDRAHQSIFDLMTPIVSAVVFGSTGQTGQHILATLLAMDSTRTVYTCSRRAPKSESPKLSAQIEHDTSKWAGNLLAIQPPPDVAISALGVTRAEAGSAENQWKIDHDRMSILNASYLIA